MTPVAISKIKRHQIYLNDVFLQIMARKLTNLSVFTPASASRQDAGSFYIGTKFGRKKITERACSLELMTDVFAK